MAEKEDVHQGNALKCTVRRGNRRKKQEKHHAVEGYRGSCCPSSLAANEHHQYSPRILVHLQRTVREGRPPICGAAICAHRFEPRLLQALCQRNRASVSGWEAFTRVRGRGANATLAAVPTSNVNAPYDTSHQQQQASRVRFSECVL